MTVGEKIRSTRKERNMTQKQLAEKSGLIETTIRKYEAGTQTPKLKNLQKIASALECPLNHFINTTSFTSAEMSAIMSASKALYPDGEKPSLDTLPLIVDFDSGWANMNAYQYVSNLKTILNAPEWGSWFDAFKDLTRDEAMQIWDFAKWVKSQRAKDGGTDAT